ncbi:O-methyltransferase [Clostridium lundense]|uniref:O-methyltransferase n=1 Tax=Clostridium lundense TaxID=319475 RepID=UPI000480902E|nr:O-methyltransferase [Clostridium lundense]
MDFNKINLYIDNLYEQNAELTKKEFINNIKLKDFIPIVDDDVIRFLKLVVQATKPRRILEIGTSIGYSTIYMAKIVKEYGDKIITIECDEKIAAQAKQNFINAGVADFIELKIGDAKEILPNIKDEFDLIFQNADKKLYSLLFNDCLKILKTGGLLVAEDTLFPVLDLDAKWHDLIKTIEQFNQMVVNCPNLESTLLPIGKGVIIAVKK